jgi:hypothetical protein
MSWSCAESLEKEEQVAARAAGVEQGLGTDVAAFGEGESFLDVFLHELWHKQAVRPEPLCNDGLRVREARRIHCASGVHS